MRSWPAVITGSAEIAVALPRFAGAEGLDVVVPAPMRRALGVAAVSRVRCA